MFKTTDSFVLRSTSRRLMNADSSHLEFNKNFVKLGMTRLIIVPVFPGAKRQVIKLFRSHLAGKAVLGKVSQQIEKAEWKMKF